MELIAILRGITPTEVVDHVDVLVDAGISSIEVPLNSPDAFASIEILVGRYGGDVEIGAGTVTTLNQVNQLNALGARLIVSPNCNFHVIARSRELGLRALPGVMTPTECFEAIEAGASGLKVFPADVVGPSGIKAMRAVLPPEFPVFAVGGVDAKNLAVWRDTGVMGAGLGSSLYSAGQSIQDTKTRAAAFVAAAHDKRDPKK